MRYLPICPPDLLQVVANDEWIFALAQYVKSDIRYREWLRHFRGKIILDNGAAEGERVSFDEVVALGEYIGATEIILPDELGDRKWTVEMTTDLAALELVAPERRVIVPQADSLAGWMDCLAEIHEALEGQYVTIALPKLYEQYPGGRAQLLTALSTAGYTKRYNIHMLGFYNKPITEVVQAAAVYPGIRTWDGAAAVSYAQHNDHINDLRWYSLDWKQPANVYGVLGNAAWLQHLMKAVA